MAVADINKELLADLRAKAQNEASWDALVAKEKETVIAQRDALQKISEETSSKRVDAATARLDAAKKKAAELRDAIAATKKNSAISPLRFGDFIRARGHLYAELRQRHEVLKAAGVLSREDLRIADIEEALATVEKWPDTSIETKKKIDELDVTAQLFEKEGADVHTVEPLRTLLGESQKLYDAHSASLLREKHRREDYAESLAKFLKSESQVVQWCRQQRAALEGVKDAQHIQEFCASFQNNVTVMETNFVVLMELSESLVPHPDVERAILEAAEVWLGLEVFVYEKLRSTLLDLHIKSGLEKEARSWASFSARFKKLLDDAMKVLEIPADAESQSLTTPVLERCKQLSNDHDPHLIITEHLADFSLREGCVKEHYDAIRRTIFSRLTLMTQTFHGQCNYERKQEYTDRMAELSDWIQCKSQSTAWKELLARIERMKQLVEDSDSFQSTTE